MVILYTKGIQTAISTHFTTRDFDCHCKRLDCKDTLIEENLIIALEELWALAGDFEISSGYRCPDHNKEIGGVKNSQHSLGNAADCKSKKLVGKEMAKLAELVPFFHLGGIGTYPTFAHCDVRKNGAARWNFTKC